MEELPKQRQGLSSLEVEGEVVVLDRAAKKVHQLNGAASFIWDRCDGTHTAGDIARELKRTFEIDAAGAERDVAAALEQLAGLGLLEEAVVAAEETTVI